MPVANCFAPARSWAHFAKCAKPHPTFNENGGTPVARPQHDAAAVIKHNRVRTGRALIERQEGLHFSSLFSLTSHKARETPRTPVSRPVRDA